MRDAPFCLRSVAALQIVVEVSAMSSISMQTRSLTLPTRIMSETSAVGVDTDGPLLNNAVCEDDLRSNGSVLPRDL